MKHISAQNWDVIIPRLTASARRRMLFWEKDAWSRRTPRFRANLHDRQAALKEWQALVDKTLRNTPFRGEVCDDTQTSMLIVVTRISYAEVMRLRLAA